MKKVKELFAEIIEETDAVDISEAYREKLLTYRTIRNAMHILMHTPLLRTLFLKAMHIEDRVQENGELSRSVYHMLNAMIGDPPDNSFDTTMNHLKKSPELFSKVETNLFISIAQYKKIKQSINMGNPTNDLCHEIEGCLDNYELTNIDDEFIKKWRKEIQDRSLVVMKNYIHLNKNSLENQIGSISYVMNNGEVVIPFIEDESTVHRIYHSEVLYTGKFVEFKDENQISVFLSHENPAREETFNISSVSILH
ncbi:MAG: hypothetical protein HQK84_00795 [Nitrospinae bacterium]|nr:hypothetical protein [Nitrospinota bacterium]